MGYSLWGHKESDTTEQLHFHFTICQAELLLGRKVMTNLDSILKSRVITLPTKVCLVKATFFLVVMYGCESWTVRRSNKFILKQISPGISLEGMMLKLKLQYFGHLM